MAGTVAEETIILIKAQVDQLVKDMGVVTKALEKTDKQSQSTARSADNMAGSMTAMARRIVLAVGAVKTIMAGIDFNTFIESQEMAMGVMLKSTDLAISKISELREFSLGLPVTFRDAVSGAKQLLAYGIPHTELTDTLQMLGDITRALNIPMNDMIYLYGTLRTQGRAYARDLMQFGMRGIPIYESLAETMKVPASQIQKLTAEGKVGWQEAEKAFKYMTSASGKFAGLMEKSRQTFAGMKIMLTNLAQVTAGAFSEKMFTSLERTVPSITMLLKENMESFRASGEAVGQVFGILLSSLSGFLEILLAINRANKTLIAILVGSGGLLMALIAIQKAMKTLFNISYKLFSGTGSIVAGIMAVSIIITTIVGKVKEAQRAAAEMQRQVDDVILASNKLQLQQNKWQGIPGMSQTLADFAKLTGAYDEVLEVAQQAVDVNSELLNQGTLFERIGRGVRKSFIGSEVVANRRLQEWIKDFPVLLGTAMSQGEDVVRKTFGGTVRTSFEEVKKVIQSDTVKKMFGDAMVNMQAALTQLNTLTKAWQAAKEIDPNSDLAKQYGGQIEALKNRIQTDYIPIIKDVLDLMNGSTEAAERLVDRLTKALTEAGGPTDTIKHWWDWVEDRMTVALSEFVIDPDQQKYSGQRAAQSFIAGLQQPLKDAQLISSMIEDDNKTYVEAAKNAADNILGVLQDMFSDATRNGIPINEMFTENDAIVQGLVAEYKRLQQVIEELGGKTDDWLSKWLDGFAEIMDTHKEYLATYARDELGQITAVVEYQREKSKEEAIKSLDEQMKNWAVVRQEIKDTYGLEFDTKKELYQFVRKLIDEQYDYEAQLIRRQDDLRRNNIQQQMKLTGPLNVYGEPQNYEERKSAAKELWGLQVAAAMSIVDSAERELALYQAHAQWNATIAAIDDEILSAKLKTLGLEMQLMRAQSGSVYNLDAQLEIINDIYDKQLEELQLQMKGDDLKLASQALELERQKEITNEYIRQYQILMQGNSEYWNAVQEGISRSIKSGDWAAAISGQAQMGLQGTQVGNVMASGDPLTAVVLQLVQGFMEAVKQVESLNEVLNFGTTIFQGMMDVIGPFLNSIFKPFAERFRVLGAIVGGLIAIVMALNPSFQILRIVVGIVADVLKWFYNKVIMPLGNAIIKTINAVITALNKIPFISIALVELLEPIIDDIQEYNSALKEGIDYLTGELKSWVDKQIGSIRDLYDVGAITGAEYSKQVQDIMDMYGSYIDADSELAKFFGDLNPQGIVNAIEELKALQTETTGTAHDTVYYLSQMRDLLAIIASNQEASSNGGGLGGGGRGGTGTFADRSPVTLPDGTVLIPKSLSALSVGGRKTLGDVGGGNTINVTVEGSVVTARDLAEELNDIMTQQSRRGYII